MTIIMMKLKSTLVTAWIREMNYCPPIDSDMFFTTTNSKDYSTIKAMKSTKKQARTQRET